MIETFHIRNFKALRDVSLALSPGFLPTSKPSRQLWANRCNDYRIPSD